MGVAVIFTYSILEVVPLHFQVRWSCCSSVCLWRSSPTPLVHCRPKGNAPVSLLSTRLWGECYGSRGVQAVHGSVSVYLRYSYFHGAKLAPRQRFTTRQAELMCNATIQCYPPGVQSAPTSLIECTRKSISIAVNLHAVVCLRPQVYRSGVDCGLHKGQTDLKMHRIISCSCDNRWAFLVLSHVGNPAKYRPQYCQLWDGVCIHTVQWNLSHQTLVCKGSCTCH